MKTFLFVTLAVMCCCGAAYGKAEPPKEFDLQGFIDGEIKAGKKRIIIPPRRYRVAPRHETHLYFKHLADVEIIATGVEMICTHTTRAVVLENCRNVRLTGLTIDYDPLPFTQGRIVTVGPDKNWVEFEIIAGYPENQLQERVEIFDPATRQQRRETLGWANQTPGWASEIESLGNHRYRIGKPKTYRYHADWDTEQVGDILVTNNAFPDGARGHAVCALRCSGLKLEDMTLYASPSFAFLERQCDGTMYLRCKIDRRAPEKDTGKRGFPRMRSLNADAFHSIEATKGPAIIGCVARFQGDDCINIQGTYHYVAGGRGNQLRIAALGYLSIEPGDPVEFLPYEGPRPPDAVAVKLEPDAAINDLEKAFIQKLHLYPLFKQQLLTGQGKFFKLTIDRPVVLPAGSGVCAGNRNGNGFVVKDCDFGHNRSRGIVIKGSRGHVVGNRIAHGWMAAILVAPEFWWLESSAASDVVIRGNTFIGCRRTAVEVAARGGNCRPLPAGTHHNITISSNTFTGCAWPSIHATSTDRLTIEGNRFTQTQPSAFVPPVAHPWNWETNAPTAIVTELCSEVRVQTPPNRQAK